MKTKGLSIRRCRHCGRRFQKTHRREVYCDVTCRLWAKINVRSSNECWPWIGCTRNGYGRFKIADRHVNAHRVAYGLARGPIPDGFCILHHCDNPSCCNPEHLFPGTHADNMRDMVVKGRADNRGMKNGRAKLTDAEILAIRLDCRRQRDIAVDYGVQQAAISKIKRGATWYHLREAA